MSRLQTVLAFASSICLFAVTAHSAEEQIAVRQLQMLKLPDVSIEKVEHFKAGMNDADVDHLQVLGTIGGNIGFELLLPDKWNERFVMGGGGLFVGTIHNAARQSVNKGFATVGTDTGHQSPSYYDAEWAYLDFEAQLNFGYLAVHRTAVTAKEIIRRYYGREALFSYFYGCSTGGRQAQIEAARYPEDFDGIVSGCPVSSKTGLYAAFIQHEQLFFPKGPDKDEALITEELLTKFHKQVLDQLDDLDGLKDGIINDPLNLALDWGQISGLNRQQVHALKLTYDGPTTDNHRLYPGLPLGSEERWYYWFAGLDPTGQEASSRLGRACRGFGRYFVFDDATWSPLDYKLADWSKDSQRAAKIINSPDSNLHSFFESDGKLIVWHGLCDGALTARASVDYFESIDHESRDEFMRLYLLPGVQHCGGGLGPSEIDWLQVIAAWTESGKAPNRLILKKTMEQGKSFERPIYPYPTTVKFNGGDPHDSSNFEPVNP